MLRSTYSRQAIIKNSSYFARQKSCRALQTSASLRDTALARSVVEESQDVASMDLLLKAVSEFVSRYIVLQS